MKTTMINMQGAIDLHFHSHPSLFPSIGDDVDMAVHARQVGMRALQYKCHHESTVSRAYLIRKMVPDVECFGGIVLNTYVGGFNPAAVEASLVFGGKSVWMPTIDASNHREAYGRTGSFDVMEGGRDSGKGLKALNESGRLKPELYEIIDLVAKHDVILGTSHLSVTEIVTLVREAHNRGVQKILITHPFFKVPNMDLETLQGLVRLGAMVEFGYCTVSPQWACASIKDVRHAIAVVGAQNAVLVSGAGQRHNPMPGEALRVFAQGLHEAGVSEEDIYRMICINPVDLLGLPRLGAYPDDGAKHYVTPI
jgi:hypothetical protein